MKNNMTQEQKDQLIEHLAWLQKISRDEEHKIYMEGINFCIGSIAAWMSNCNEEEWKKTLTIIKEKAA